jgi:hypothetical protein
MLRLKTPAGEIQAQHGKPSFRKCFELIPDSGDLSGEDIRINKSRPRRIVCKWRTKQDILEHLLFQCLSDNGFVVEFSKSVGAGVELRISIGLANENKTGGPFGGLLCDLPRFLRR